MFRSYYGLSFNPFDKQAAREKDRFLSKDISEMLSRLDYLKDTRGIGLFTARPGMGKSFGLRCFAKGLNPNRIPLSLHRQRHGVLPPALLCPWRGAKRR